MIYEDRVRRRLLEAYDSTHRKYEDRARKRVLDAYEAFDIDEFCQISGLSRHSCSSMMCDARHGGPIGIQHFDRVANLLGLNIAEIFLTDDEIMNNFEYYEGAEIRYYSMHIKRLMDKKGITVYELAKKANVNYETIVNYLNGKPRFPRIHNLEKIANALGIELPELFLPQKEGETND